eukprot:gnl/MRDRNA2_/MRDRNA2_66484_c0_seq1.p1 gnl/MRDRNA2_/MRDRNA2_66484_c0~~gnl/MRDRNA2_/MRDRNA2_66484_c0_seq1.p1  ORF type:complete len:229 (+),score=52.37 gnl/MRDRNA2_/MRDRNA2_66484_c0_seq1:111-797(+)
MQRGRHGLKSTVDARVKGLESAYQEHIDKLALNLLQHERRCMLRADKDSRQYERRQSLQARLEKAQEQKIEQMRERAALLQERRCERDERRRMAQEEKTQLRFEVRQRKCNEKKTQKREETQRRQAATETYICQQISSLLRVWRVAQARQHQRDTRKDANLQKRGSKQRASHAKQELTRKRILQQAAHQEKKRRRQVFQAQWKWMMRKDITMHEILAGFDEVNSTQRS